MYGSQNHFQQSFSISAMQTENSNQCLLSNRTINRKKSKLIQILVILFSLLSLSTLTYAGPKEPRLKGGNGNASGR